MAEEAEQKAAKAAHKHFKLVSSSSPSSLSEPIVIPSSNKLASDTMILPSSFRVSGQVRTITRTPPIVMWSTWGAWDLHMAFRIRSISASRLRRVRRNTFWQLSI
ncbi:hypothetical protein G7K_1992-t1 [Saitoella complicata NRRL Y-17804]|uniref:Uncharacterized protein n=1 Tax=Saitoella complicata (strain BCRC 22490 / CBS 7301 / JCM 7358 / NBRC 10748 / NRRL Y-17804) TaxID=698492 RepID=A0A0E9ND76_SAICN|nr:hypothetical protein G7K_1992-t1 [Saitoella complicata NRRL Y-17804]